MHIAERGETLYREVLKSRLEPQENGKFIAIDIESGEYFLGDDALTAMTAAHEKYPAKLFHLMRVGFSAAFQNNRVLKNPALAYGRFF